MHWTAPHPHLPKIHPAVVAHRHHITKAVVTVGIMFSLFLPGHEFVVAVAAATNLLWIWA